MKTFSAKLFLAYRREEQRKKVSNITELVSSHWLSDTVRL